MKKIGDITNTADKNGEFTDGNVAAGTPPTQLMGAWFNSVQREILNVLAKAGIPQSATKEDQLAEAITKIVAGAGYLPTGYSYSKIESDDRYQPKGNYAPSGDYVTNTILNNGLDKKLDKDNPSANGSLSVRGKGDYAILSLYKQSGERVDIETLSDTANSSLNVIYRDKEGKNVAVTSIPKKTGTAMLIGDYGFGRASSTYISTEKISDYRTNSIAYGEGSKGDSFLSVNNHILNIFGFTASTYGYQMGFAAGQERVGFRAIINNVVKDWHEFYTTANTQSDHNGNVKIPGYLERSDYPVGCPIAWPQATAPSGYLVCNGQTFNKTTYPLLAKAYPTGILPDLRGEFLRGLDAGRNIDSGRAALSSQGDDNKEHDHNIILKNGNGDGGSNENALRTLAINISNGTYTTAKSGGKESRPRNIAFLYIVRAA